MTDQQPLIDRTVLVIDDDQMMLELAVPLLGALGCDNVVLAANRLEASTIIQSDQHFDVAIVDVTLNQEQSGFELARMIVALRPEVDVIQISALHRLAEYPVPEGVRTLQKPFGLSDLRTMLASDDH